MNSKGEYVTRLIVPATNFKQHSQIWDTWPSKIFLTKMELITQDQLSPKRPNWKRHSKNCILTLLCHGIESTLLGWFYDLIFTCCLCAGNSLFIESTQKGQFYGSKSSRPGYVPRETFFIESPQMGRFYESEPARPWLYCQKLLIRDICPFSEVPRVYCLDFWKNSRQN
jgi:hypothetical protein